jgi:hypothetical protein
MEGTVPAAIPQLDVPLHIQTFDGPMIGDSGPIVNGAAAESFGVLEPFAGVAFGQQDRGGLQVPMVAEDFPFVEEGTLFLVRLAFPRGGQLLPQLQVRMAEYPTLVPSQALAHVLLLDINAIG